MAYIKGTDRDQIVLFPDAIDDYVEEDNPVTFIEAFVDSLNLVELGFKYAKAKPTGRPPYSPADMLKLFIYGYLNRVRSSRRLEREAKRNVEVIWLLRKLTPDFKTIADFRKDNLDPIKEVSKEFTLLCKGLDLFGGELVAIDGSKFKASNSKKQNFTERKLKKTLKGIDEKIDEYLSDLEGNDQEEAGIHRPTAEELKEKIDWLKSKKGKYQDLLSDMQKSKETEVSLTDPDARSMMNSQRVEVCYNAQMTVDAKHKLILDCEVTNEAADQHQLFKMAKRAKDILQIDKLEVLADKGYYDGGEVKACEDENLTVFIPKPAQKATSSGCFPKDAFFYNKEDDTYSCPSNQTLSYIRTVVRKDTRSPRRKDKRVRLYMGQACRGCSLRPKCTPNIKGRTITRLEHEDVLERMQERVASNRDKVRMRQWLSEHPFGTIKRSFEQGYMLLRGLEKVNTEINLSALAYNMKRAINIIGVRGLIAAVT